MAVIDSLNSLVNKVLSSPGTRYFLVAREGGTRRRRARSTFPVVSGGVRMI